MSSMNSLSFPFATSADVSLPCMIISRPSTTRHTLHSVPYRTGRQVSRRCDLDRNPIIDRLANLLTHTTSDTPFRSHHQVECVKIHRKGLNRAFRYTGVAALSCRANTVRHRRQPHSHTKAIGNRQECLGRTSGDTGEIVA